MPPEKLFNNCYYKADKPVINEGKTTTKKLIVNDALSKQVDSLFLNERLNPGSNWNLNILFEILEFRLFKIAFSADIEKLFTV